MFSPGAATISVFLTSFYAAHASACPLVPVVSFSALFVLLASENRQLPLICF
jgi:hypothetical protein